jgi:hypothetical protein
MTRAILLLAVLFCCPFVRSQTILFTKGAELEYKTFSSKPTGFMKLELYEVTRITLTVTDVKDSNGVKYSYITKTGKAIERPEQNSYEKKYIIRQEDNKMKIPKDLFSVDTVYLSDRYPELRKGSGYHAVMNMKDDNYMVLDLDSNASGIFSYSSTSEEIDVKSREFIVEGQQSKRQAGDQIYYGGTLRTNDYTIHISSIGIKNEGETKFKVKAGSFKCFKLSTTSKIKIKGAGLLAALMKSETTAVVYYSPELGILKTEDTNGKNQTGYMELVRVKR